MWTVAINILEPGAFNSESQYFIPLFNRISWLFVQHPTGNEASNGGCNSGPIGHDFQDNSNIYLFVITMRIGSFSRCEIRFGFHIGCQVRTWAVFPIQLSLAWEPERFSQSSSLSRENLQSGSHDGCRIWFSLAGYQLMGENHPTLVWTIDSSFWTISESENCQFGWNLSKLCL